MYKNIIADPLAETVEPNDLKKFENIYHEQLHKNDITPKVQFEYSWCLVRSRFPADMRKGIILLEDLCKTQEDGHRDYLYYLIIGNARLKEYSKALTYCRKFLDIEPGNQQVTQLEVDIKKKLEKEGLLGLAVAAGVTLVAGAIVGAGVAIAKNIKR